MDATVKPDHRPKARCAAARRQASVPPAAGIRHSWSCRITAYFSLPAIQEQTETAAKPESWAAPIKTMG